jgi:hypothetical protein
VVIEEIAKIIAEDEEEFVTCPSCGNKYAMVYGNEVACPNEKCRNYDEDYIDAMLEIVPIEIETYFSCMHDADLHDVLFVAEKAAETGNVRFVPWHRAEYDWVIVVWDGPNNISDDRLSRELEANYVRDVGPEEAAANE